MDQEFLAFALIIIILASITGVAVLINRGAAKPGVVVIILLMPVLFMFWIHLLKGGIPRRYGSLSGELIIGIIASLIAGLILLGIRKK